MPVLVVPRTPPRHPGGNDCVTIALPNFAL
jgi:hypothetical protein